MAEQDRLECSEEWHCGCAGIAMRLSRRIAELERELNHRRRAYDEFVREANRHAAGWRQERSDLYVENKGLRERAEANEQESSYVAAFGEFLTAEVNDHETTKARAERAEEALTRLRTLARNALVAAQRVIDGSFTDSERVLRRKGRAWDRAAHRPEEALGR